MFVSKFCNVDVGGSVDVRTGESGKMNSLSDSCCVTFVTPALSDRARKSEKQEERREPIGESNGTNKMTKYKIKSI